ncbi:hypothetical protein HK101_002736 [Irineochytrium annulatum]|nr:hypothetical protein HK101_002736 [Irineochytrium annulatum]
MYRTVKRLGIPDSNILLMLSDDVACNSRNHFPATVYNNAGKMLDLYGSNIEVDYRGYEVTVENFIRVLTGRHDDFVPRSKRLLTDDRSNVLIFMTGHGGDEFLKFQDAEEISSHDVADAIAQMFEKRRVHTRYHEIFLMIETCQAASMYKRIYSPNVLAAASSLTGENSLSHHTDVDIGVAVIDRFTYYNLETLEKLQRGDSFTMTNLFSTYDPQQILSTPGIRTDLFSRGAATSNATLKAQAEAYCAQIRADPNSWDLCLNLFTALPRRAPEARFVALELVRAKIDVAPEQLRRRLWPWIESNLDANDSAFVLNKLAQVIVLIFKTQYNNSWPSFFQDILSLLTNSANTQRAETMVVFFLQLCATIDEEIASPDVFRTPAEVERNTRVKDKMREDAVIRLRDVWFELLRESMRSNNTTIADKVLRLIGVYVAWVDIKLFIDTAFISSLYDFLGTMELRNAGVFCLTGIVDKGMNASDKLELLQMLGVTDILERIVGVEEDGDFMDAVAKLVNSLGLGLCTCWKQSPASSPGRTAASEMLEKVLPYAVRVFGNAYDDTSVLVFPFIDEFLKLLKEYRKSRDYLQGPGLKYFADSVLVLVRVILAKMKYDEDEPVEFGEGAGEDEAQFDQFRRTLKGKVDTLLDIDSSTVLSYYSSIIINTFDAIIAGLATGKSVGSTIKWSDAELALHLLINLKVDDVKVGPVYAAADGTPTPLATMMAKMMQSTISSYPHASVPLKFFENVSRYSGFFVIHPEYIGDALQSFVDLR